MGDGWYMLLMIVVGMRYMLVWMVSVVLICYFDCVLDDYGRVLLDDCCYIGVIAVKMMCK